MNKTKRRLAIRNWYGFKVCCDFYDFGMTNMVVPSKQQWCLRKGRDGKKRPKHRPFICAKNACPILKGKIEMNKEQKTCL